ncbi:putative transmembrane protein, partial [Toxoplasma gondii TgCatPRC2]
ACEEHIDSRKSLPLSETTPDFGTYYPLPIPLLWLHILRSAQKLGIKNITKICWEKLWSLFCETTRVSPTASGHTLCHFKPFIAERQSPYVLDALAQAICAKYARVPLNTSLSGSQQEGRREQERRQHRASRVLIAVEASSIACNYTYLFCAVAAYDALLRPLLCLHTLPPFLLDGLVKCLVAMEGVPRTAWHPRGRALFGLLTSRLLLIQTQSLQARRPRRARERDKEERRAKKKRSGERITPKRKKGERRTVSEGPTKAATDDDAQTAHTRREDVPQIGRQ